MNNFSDAILSQLSQIGIELGDDEETANSISKIKLTDGKSKKLTKANVEVIANTYKERSKS